MKFSDPNHPEYDPKTWDKAVEMVDTFHGYSIEFSASPSNHQIEYEEVYDLLRRRAELASNRFELAFGNGECWAFDWSMEK